MIKVKNSKEKKATVKTTKKQIAKKTTRRNVSSRKASPKKRIVNKKLSKKEMIINFIKKYKIIFIGVFAVIAIFIMIYSTAHYGPFEDLKKKIDNKETFVIIIGSDEYITDSYKKMLDYYHDTYDFKYVYIDLYEWPSTTYNELVKLMKLDKKTLDYPYLLYVEKGKATISSTNARDENAVKSFLMNANIIKKEYEENDYLLNDDEFKDFINDKNGSILFYARNDEYIYKYRKKLLKANAKISIIYAERLNNQEIENELRKMLKLSQDKEFNLPMLIKFKSGKIVDYEDNIGLSRLIDAYKKLEKK